MPQSRPPAVVSQKEEFKAEVKAPSLNKNAKTFTFSINASSFTPQGPQQRQQQPMVYEYQEYDNNMEIHYQQYGYHQQGGYNYPGNNTMMQGYGYPYQQHYQEYDHNMELYYQQYGYHQQGGYNYPGNNTMMQGYGYPYQQHYQEYDHNMELHYQQYGYYQQEEYNY